MVYPLLIKSKKLLVKAVQKLAKSQASFRRAAKLSNPRQGLLNAGRKKPTKSRKSSPKLRKLVYRKKRSIRKEYI